MYAFLTKHTHDVLLHPCQHGFRARRSTHTALLTVEDKWLQGVDSGQVSTVVFLVRSGQSIRYSETPATFEKNLSTLGICGTELDWFSYLTNLSTTVPCPRISLPLVVSPKCLGSFSVSYHFVNTLPDLYQVW